MRSLFTKHNVYKKDVMIGLLLFFNLTLYSKVYCQYDNPNLGIIPAPVSIKKMNGDFIFSTYTHIVCHHPNDKAFICLKAFLKKEEFVDNKLTAKSSNRSKSYPADKLVLTSSGTDGLPEEGYRMTITPGKIIIAGNGAGLFYGVQTFIQLLPLQKSDVAKIPSATIEDYPRFAYRGFMLDVARHFFPVDFIKKVLDLMAANKLNRFHWHLTDSEGWRIQINKYPKLTSVGAYTIYPLTGGSPTGAGGYRDGLDSVSRGGYYTQDQIREIIKYAADRYITIIPEIEMPGHSRAALRAYPELMCHSIAEPANEYNNNTYCPTEATFQFLDNVLSEVIDLFPGKYIHIGGDEVNKGPWKGSEFCQQLIKKLNLKNEDGLQSYFMRRIEQFVNSKGKSIIGWDEILEGGLAPNATVMSWRGEQGGIDAAKLKHYVIMTPGINGLYFDNAQSLSPEEPVNIGGYAPLQKTYSYNPVPASLNNDEKKYILGVQANLWTEFISTPAKVEYMMFPRLFGLAEVAWSPLTKKNYQDFSTVRLPVHLAKLEQNGIDFRVPIPFGISDTTMIGPRFTFNLTPPLPGAKIYYTLSGLKPNYTDPVYDNPLQFFIPFGQSRVLGTRVITQSGRRSISTKAIMKNVAPLMSVKVNSPQAGLKYQLYKNDLFVDTLSQNKCIDSGIVRTINIKGLKTENPLIGLTIEGYLKIEKGDIYSFAVEPANKAQVFIDGENILFINDENIRNNETAAMKREAVPLAKGFHKFQINYFNNNAKPLKILMAEQGETPHEIPAQMLFH